MTFQGYLNDNNNLLIKNRFANGSLSNNKTVSILSNNLDLKNNEFYNVKSTKPISSLQSINPIENSYQRKTVSKKLSQIGRRKNLFIIPINKSTEVYMENNIQINDGPSTKLNKIIDKTLINNNNLIKQSASIDDENKLITFKNTFKNNETFDLQTKTSIVSTNSIITLPELPSTSRLEPIRVFKFENFSDQPSGHIVDLCISENELVFYSRTCEKRPKVEAIFLDEIIDAFIGNHNDSLKPKNDSQIQRIFAATFETVSCVLADCIVTVTYGLDFVNPQNFVFLTKSSEIAKKWCDEFRNYSVKFYQKVQDVFYYWRRHFAKLQSTLLINEQLTVDYILDTIFPYVKQRDERNILEKTILQELSILKDKNKSTPKLLSDDKFLFALYKIVTLKRLDVKEIFIKK